MGSLLPADWAGDVNEPMTKLGGAERLTPDFAEFTLGRTEGATRGSHSGYLLSSNFAFFRTICVMSEKNEYRCSRR